MRLSADYPIKPERRSFADGYNDNVTEILTEDTIPESENWEQKCYDQNDRSGEESSQKTHSPIQELLLSKDQVEKTHDVREMPQNDIAAEISESPLQVGKQSRDDFMSYDYDKFNNAFANNSVISTDNDNEGIVNCTDNNNDNIANNTLTKTRNNGPSAILTPSDKMINDAQYSSLAKRISGFELTGQNNDSITTGTNNDSGSNSKVNFINDLARVMRYVTDFSCHILLFNSFVELYSLIFIIEKNSLSLNHWLFQGRRELYRKDQN